MKKGEKGLRGMSFGRKLTFIFVLAIIIPVMLVGSIAYTGSYRTLTKGLMENSVTLGITMNTTLNNFIISNEQNLEMASNNLNAKDIIYKPEFEHIYLYNMLEEFQKSHPDVLNVYIGTNDKRMFVYPKAELPAGFDPTSTAWYKSAIKENKIIWTPPYVDTATGKVVVTAAKPVFSTTGELTGVFGIDISLETLSQFISETKLGKNGYFFLTSSDGTILAHKDASLLNKPVPVQEIMDRIKGNTKESIDYKYNGENKNANIVKNEKIGWNIIGTMDYEEIKEDSRNILYIIGIAALLIAGLGAAVSLFLSRSITKPITTLSEDLEKIGDGDFTVRANIKSKDEFGMLASTLNGMVEDLGALMKTIKGMSEEIATASDTLASTSEETNAVTEEIARTIDEVAGATNDQAKGTETGLVKANELSDSIQKVSNAIEKMKNEIADAIKLNTNGTDTVKLLIEKTEDNNKASLKVADVISEVDNRTAQIGFIIDTIGQIAQQTNLLALNASIEAARAGEAGRGFSVVADEIRKLAEQSSTAASQIRDLITGIQEQAKNAVSTMETAKEVTVVQSGAVLETERIFADITNSIAAVNRGIEAIISLNGSMVGKKDEIISVVENISASAQQTAASTQEISASTQQQLGAVEEVANTAGELSGLAEKLNNAIEKFRV